MRTTNPVFRKSVWDDDRALTDKPMTVSGTLNKLMLLTVIMLIAAGAVYYQFALKRYDFVSLMMMTGCFAGLVLGLIISFKPNTTPYLSPLYAFSQGAMISGVSCFFEAELPGIVIQATSMTMLVVGVMALLYKTGLIRATEKFRSVVLTATLAIAIFYVISMLLMLFHVNVPYFTSTSPLAIGINIFIAGIAALNLILDFDFIERGSERMLPSVYEWYGAFGLMVTIIWLYLEILRLLSRLRRN